MSNLPPEQMTARPITIPDHASDVCGQCGAVVENVPLHVNWHARLDLILAQLRREPLPWQ